MSLPEFLHPSLGTAGSLGLKDVRMLAMPGTAYIMLGERCISNCAFCTQRREKRKVDRLSRVVWPKYPARDVITALRNSKEKFARICFQTLDYPQAVDDLISIMKKIRGILPVSVSMVPVSEEEMKDLKDAGIEYLSIALDAADREIFHRIKGYGVGNRFRWEDHWEALRRTVKIFGKGNTHLIVGLGESDRDLISTMIKLRDAGIYTALFAHTPVTCGKPPDIRRYRAIQLAHSLIYEKKWKRFHFEDGKLRDLNADMEILKDVMNTAFLTSGCPGCNRPFYNERPGKELYNYPYLPERVLIEKAYLDAVDYLNGE